MLAAILASLVGSMTLAAIAVAQPGFGEAEDDADGQALPPPPDTVDGMVVEEGGRWSEDYLGTADGDWIATGRSCDTVHGGAGDDTLYGERGRDFLDGEEGDDLLDGGAWNDVLDGGAGDDTLLGDTGMDTLLGGQGHDSIFGGEWNDVLIGGEGDDVLEGDGGNDILIGDGAALPGEAEVSARAFHEALEMVFDDPSAYNGLSPVEQVAAAQSLLDNLASIYLGESVGSEGADMLDGGAGDDTLYGNEGDELTGGEGADTFVVSEWEAIEGGEGAQILDFNADEDELVLQYDADEIAPVITVTTLENGDQQIFGDAALLGTLVQPVVLISASDVVLDAVSIGTPNAGA
jgi:Ca2+-binding RTX toxin-like protein